MKERLSERLRRPLPGSSAHRLMAPELAYGRHGDPPLPTSRKAAVTLLLYPARGRWHVPLTVRRADLARHAGQISLPGGLVDPGETEAQAALRELEEELSTPAECVEIVGQLTPVFVFNSDSWVVPWVAVAADRPPLNLNPSEVDDLLEVPVDHLLGPAHRGTHEEARGSVRFAAPHFQFGPHRIWGATAMILSELLAVWTDAVGD